MTKFNLTTSNKALNWLIEKANVTPQELTTEDKADGSIAYWDGYFNANLPYRMAQEIKSYSAKNTSYSNKGQGHYTRSITHYLQAEIIDNTAYLVYINFTFGETKRTNSRVKFSVYCEAFTNPTSEEIAKITSKEILK